MERAGAGLEPLGCPAVSGPFRYLVARRPLADGRTLGDRRGEQHSLTVGGFSGHGTSGTRWQLGTEAPHGPAHGSQPGAQAGRHALERQELN